MARVGQIFQCFLCEYELPVWHSGDLRFSKDKFSWTLVGCSDNSGGCSWFNEGCADHWWPVAITIITYLTSGWYHTDLVPRVLDWFWYVLHTYCTVYTLQCINPWSKVVQFLSKWGSLCFQWRTWLDIMGTVADIGQYMLRGWQDSVHVMSRICGLAVLVVLVERVTFSDLCVLMRPRLFRP